MTAVILEGTGYATADESNRLDITARILVVHRAAAIARDICLR
jgi:hypothetical protein